MAFWNVRGKQRPPSRSGKFWSLIIIFGITIKKKKEYVIVCSANVANTCSSISRTPLWTGVFARKLICKSALGTSLGYLFIRSERRNRIDEPAYGELWSQICASESPRHNILVNESNEKYDPRGRFAKLRPILKKKRSKNMLIFTPEDTACTVLRPFAARRSWNHWTFSQFAEDTSVNMVSFICIIVINLDNSVIT